MNYPRAAKACPERSRRVEFELVDQAPNIFQTELDPKALKAVEPGERLFVGHEIEDK
jgi:hypothetical protein